MGRTDSLSRRMTKKSSNAGLSLRASFSWTLASNAFYAFTMWCTLTVLTKLFEPEAFGRYALASSFAAPIVVASGLNLRAIYVSEVEKQPDLSAFLVLRLTMSLLALIVLVVLAAVGVTPRHLLSLTLAIGGSEVVLLGKDLYQGAMQREERMDLVAISRALQGGVSLAAALLAALTTQSMIVVVIGMLVARTATLLLYDLPKVRALSAGPDSRVTWRSLQRACDWSELWSLVRTAFPLGTVMIMLSFYQNVPKYFLADYGEAYVGYFVAISSVASLQVWVISALGQSASRQLALRFASDERSFTRLLGQLVILGALLGLVGVVGALAFGSALLRLLFRPEYADLAQVLVWLMGAQLALNVLSFVGYALTAARWFRLAVGTYGLMLVTLAASAWYLIPRWGGVGAAWAMLASAGIAVGVSTAVMIARLRSGRAVYNE